MSSVMSEATSLDEFFPTGASFVCQRFPPWGVDMSMLLHHARVSQSPLFISRQQPARNIYTSPLPPTPPPPFTWRVIGIMCIAMSKCSEICVQCIHCILSKSNRHFEEPYTSLDVSLKIPFYISLHTHDRLTEELNISYCASGGGINSVKCSLLIRNWQFRHIQSLSVNDKTMNSNV